MRSRAEMKMAAKRDFARYGRVFLIIGALLVMVGLIVDLPVYFSNPPTTQQAQALLNRTSDALSKGASVTPRQLNQLSLDWFNFYAGGKTTSSSAYLLGLTLLLMVGWMALQVGLSHVALMASAGGQPTIKDYFASLKHFGRWLGLYLMMFIRIYLWAILLVIPGLIAAYRYRQAVYLMLEDPELGVNRALKLSGELMRGYKWRLFVLDVSFILWLMLSTVIVLFFELDLLGTYLIPYRELTRVQFYRDLRAEHPIEGLPVVSALQVEQPPLTPEPPSVSAQ